MNWFRRITQGILTDPLDRKDVPKGLWHSCEQCRTITFTNEFKKNYHICPSCGYYDHVSAAGYFDILFDKGTAQEICKDIKPIDILQFNDTKSYKKRLIQSQNQTGLDDAMLVATGLISGTPLVIAAMDFRFIGGSMGSVVGEKIARAIDHCIAQKTPLLIISQSGGARMMESAFSLMQMAKTAAKLSQLANAKIPYISLMTNPTTGGVTASYAMLGDLNIAEPNALIGFAGPRVIKETIKKDLPEGFQSAEFLIEHGFLDLIVPRPELKKTIKQLLTYFKN